MTSMIYNIDGKSYIYNAIGKKVYDEDGRQAERIWAYPVVQGVWGGEATTLYFTTKAKRDEYMKDHDYCDKLPRCKVPAVN